MTRKKSVKTDFHGIGPVEWDCKINILDTPGYFDFVGEVRSALRVADGLWLWLIPVVSK